MDQKGAVLVIWATRKKNLTPIHSESQGERVSCAIKTFKDMLA